MQPPFSSHPRIKLGPFRGACAAHAMRAFVGRGGAGPADGVVRCLALGQGDGEGGVEDIAGAGGVDGGDLRRGHLLRRVIALCELHTRGALGHERHLRPELQHGGQRGVGVAPARPRAQRSRPGCE